MINQPTKIQDTQFPCMRTLPIKSKEKNYYTHLVIEQMDFHINSGNDCRFIQMVYQVNSHHFSWPSVCFLIICLFGCCVVIFGVNIQGTKPQTASHGTHNKRHTHWGGHEIWHKNPKLHSHHYFRKKQSHLKITILTFENQLLFFSNPNS